MSAPAASVIVSTYNQPAWLALCLTGFACQDTRDFEIIVVDDGSRDDTRALLDARRGDLPFALRHVWQEDQGFRKCRALNLGILEARGDYLIFSDGDCVPRRDFVAAHLRLRERGRFLGGGYCKLPKTVSDRIDSDAIAAGLHCDPAWLIAQGLPRKQRSLKLWARPGWRESLLNAVTPTPPRWSGNNASGWREDLVRANGFDERMTYGGEDLELGERLGNAGVRGKQVRFAAICVHLDHPRGYVEPGMRAANERIRAATRADRSARTEHGLDQHQHGPASEQSPQVMSASEPLSHRGDWARLRALLARAITPNGPGWGRREGSSSRDGSAPSSAAFASLHLASTPLIALACAGAARAHPGRARLLLLGDFEHADRLAGLLRCWRDNPFESIECLPGRFDEHARGAPDRARGLAQFFRRVAIKRALRRETLAHIAAHDAAVLPTRVWLGNDRKVETQFALKCAAKRAQGEPGEYLDDGLYTYLGDVRQRPLTRALDALVKRLTYGAWWQRTAQVGTTSWIAHAWLALPQRAPAVYSHERVRTLPREWFAGREWLRLAALAAREFGVDRRTLRRCTHVWVLPHSNLLRASPALLDALRERLRTAPARSESIALKYHPREVEPDPGALIAHGAAMILPAILPMELLLPLLPRGARIEGEASTALLAARWLRPDLDVRTFGTATHPYAQAAERLLRTLA